MFWVVYTGLEVPDWMMYDGIEKVVTKNGWTLSSLQGKYYSNHMRQKLGLYKPRDKCITEIQVEPIVITIEVPGETYCEETDASPE